MNDIVILAIALVLALVSGRLAAFFRIPRVTGYMLAGILMGPSIFEVLTRQHLVAFVIISELALGMIAFYIGCEFEASHFRRLKKTVSFFSIAEIVTTLALVLLSLLIVYYRAPAMALLLAVLAVATAPAATLLVIREYDSEGPLTDHVLAMVGLNNLFCILAFVVTLGLVELTSGAPAGLSSAAIITEMARKLLIPPLLGLALAMLLQFYLRRHPEQNELLIVSLAGVMLGVGVSYYLSVSPLLTNLVMGAVLINTCDRTQMVIDRLKQVDYPFYALFFVLAGASLHLEMLPQIGLAGGLYVAARIGGKILGTRVGKKWARAAEPDSLYLGMGLLSQAGLAIGLSSWAAKEMPALGEPLAAIILGTTAVFEVIGPVLTRVSLVRGGEVRIVKLLSSVTVGGFAAEMHLFADRIREALGMKRSYQQIDFTGPIQVRHLMRYHIDTIPPDAGLHKIVRIMEHSRYSMLPVVGKNEEWIGMIFLTAIRDLFYNKELGQLIIAQDIAHPMTALSPEDSLAHAMQVFESESVPFLPVVEPKGQRRFLGVIHHRDIYLFQVDKEKGNS